MIDGAEVFLDTNILLYASTARFDEPLKHQKAQDLLVEKFGTSSQVLAEFYVNATRKGSQPLTPDEARNWVRLLARKPFQSVDSSVVLEGIEISQSHKLSYWDGAVIAAALRLGCKTLYSEDLGHGQTFDTLTVINPFL